MHMTFSLLHNHWSIFRIYKIQTLPAVSHINIIKAHLLHAIIIILTLQGIVTAFMHLNEMFRYSLLHKRIIHTTLLFNRAFLASIWSWLSCVHNNLWNGSWIVINSSFQSLVIHNITCTHLNAFMQYITTVAPLPTFLGLLSSANMYRNDPFLYSNIHMVWGLLPLPLHGICHN